MSAQETRCVVTSRDFAQLELFARTKMSFANPIRYVLIEKLENCEVVPFGEIDPDIATLGSQVTFRVFEREPETRVLVHPDNYPTSHMDLPVTVPLGLALFGLSVGANATVTGYGGHIQRVHLMTVEHPPKRERRNSAKIVPMSRWERPSSSQFEPVPPDDDPGPAAA